MSGGSNKKMRKIQSQKDVDAVEKILTLRKRILSCDDTSEQTFRDSTFDDLKENEESTCEMLSRRNVILDEIIEHFND